MKARPAPAAVGDLVRVGDSKVVWLVDRITSPSIYPGRDVALLRAINSMRARTAWVDVLKVVDRKAAR